MGRYDREERRHDRSEPQGDDKQSSGRRRRFPWDDPDEAGDPAPAPHEPPPDPDPEPSRTLEESPAESDPERSHAGERPAAGTAEEFPLQASSGSGPAAGWDAPAADHGVHPPPQAPIGQGFGLAAPPGNGLAVAGFVLSIIALILCWLSLIDLIFVVPAIVFSAVGLRRANRQGRPHRGLAVAGLAISLVAAAIMIVLTIIYVWVADEIGDEFGRIDRIEQLDDGDLDELYRHCVDYDSWADGFEQPDPGLEYWCGELRDRYGERYDIAF